MKPFVPRAAVDSAPPSRAGAVGTLKGRVLKAEDAERCCQEAVRIGIQSLRAYLFSTLSEVWSPPSRDSVYVMQYAKIPKPGVEIDLTQGWKSANATPRPGSGGVVAVVAIGSIIIDLLAREESRGGVQTVVEMVSQAVEVAKDVALRRGQNHCHDCILGNCLSQSHPRAYRTELIRRRI